MSRCKHPLVHRATSTVVYSNGWAWWSRANICTLCKEWLSLGTAPEPEPYSLDWVQMRAAEIADAWDPDGDWNGLESLGECSPEGQHGPLIEADIARGTKTQRDLAVYLAGHLARVIVDHDSPGCQQGGE